MSFLALSKRISNPGESFYLQKKSTDGQKDEIGNFIETWEDVDLLEGGVQSAEEQSIDPKGRQEVILGYRGYFTTKLHIPQNELAIHRIKHTFAGGTQFFIIREIDRNLILNGKRNHYELILEKSDKFTE